MIIDAKERFARDGAPKQPGGQEKALVNVGEKAWNALFADMHGKFDKVSRELFAANYLQLLKKYGYVYPRYFETLYTDVAESYGSFRTMFGIMKNPNSHKLPARKIYWRNYCELLIKRLKQDGIEVSSGYIAHRLALGTEFHPTARAVTDIEQVVRLYETLATNINDKFALLDSYIELSNYVVDGNVEAIRHRSIPGDEDGIPLLGVDVIYSSLTDYFNEDYLRNKKFSGNRFIELDHDDLNYVVSELFDIAAQYSVHESETEESKVWAHYHYAQQELSKYIAKINYKSCHVPHPIWDVDFRDHAHCLLGVYVGECDDDAHIRHFLESNSRNGRWIDPVFEKVVYPDFYGGELGYTYLVLFPDKIMSQLIPCIVIQEAEGTYLVSLDEDAIAARGDNFISVRYPEPGSENHSLVELLRDHIRIKERLLETAPNVANHSILLEKKESTRRHEEMIAALCEPLDD